MSFTITPAAEAQIKAVCAERGCAPAIRVGLKSGGCKGFEQRIEFNPLTMPEDLVEDISGIKFVVDPKSKILLSGMELTWVTSLTEKRFVFTLPGKGPECSCGKSFSL
jgi:iron-sulfur cluster assembly protein